MNQKGSLTKKLLPILAILSAVLTVFAILREGLPYLLVSVPNASSGGHSALPRVLVEFYNNSPAFALVSWIFFAGAVIWRGRIRTIWGNRGFSYDAFRLFVRMKGSQTRLKILRGIAIDPSSR